MDRFSATRERYGMDPMLALEIESAYSRISSERSSAACLFVSAISWQKQFPAKFTTFNSTEDVKDLRSSSSRSEATSPRPPPLMKIVGDSDHVTCNRAHRWFHLPAMKTAELLLLKCYDSATDGGARFAPHGPFRDPTALEDAPLRERSEERRVGK